MLKNDPSTTVWDTSSSGMCLYLEFPGFYGGPFEVLEKAENPSSSIHEQNAVLPSQKTFCLFGGRYIRIAVLKLVGGKGEVDPLHYQYCSSSI